MTNPDRKDRKTRFGICLTGTGPCPQRCSCRGTAIAADNFSITVTSNGVTTTDSADTLEDFVDLGLSRRAATKA